MMLKSRRGEDVVVFSSLADRGVVRLKRPKVVCHMDCQAK